MKKVICFARVSTTQQDLQAQLDAVKTYAYSDGFTDEDILVVQGKESAIKLDEEERQTLKEIKELVTNNPNVRDIYFFAVDRLARRMSIVLSVKEWADDNKINLHFLTPHKMATLRTNEYGIVVEDEVTTLLLAMLSHGAQMEMKIKSARFQTAKNAMKQQGKLPQGKPIKGYKLADDRTIIVNEDEAEFIRAIYDDYLNGNNESLNSVHDRYVVKGFFEPLVSKFRSAGKTRVYNILKDCSYCGREKTIKRKVTLKDGTVTYKETVIKYPAIISEEIYDAVQEKLKGRIHQPKKTTKAVYYAKGLVKCGHCGAQLKTDTNCCTYKCDERKGHTLAINLNVVDNLTWLTAKGCWNIFVMLDEETNIKAYEGYIKDYENKLGIVTKAIEREYENIDIANERLRQRRMTTAQADRWIDEATENIVRLQADKVNIETNIANYKRLVEQMHQRGVINPAKLDTLDDNERLDIITKTIKEIRVIKTDRFQTAIYFELADMLKPFEQVLKAETEYWEYNSHSRTLYAIEKHYDILQDKEVLTKRDLSFHLEIKRHTPRLTRKQRAERKALKEQALKEQA